MVCNFPQWEKNTTMKFCAKCLTAVALLLSAVAGSLADAPLQAALTPVIVPARPQNTDPQTTPLQDTDQGASPAAPSQATLPAQPESAAPLRVMVDKSLLINTTERLKRISVTDPTVAYATVITPTQILVHGRAPGEVSLLIWDELERSRSFDLRVDVDVSACAEEERRVFPDEQISVTPSRAAIVLSGHVTTEDVAKRAGELASAYSKNVINVLTFGPVGAQEVLLEVKFAEVDRSAATQLGANLFSTGAGNTIGTVTTGQYGGFGSQSVTQTTGQTGPFSENQTVSNVLNLFLFRPDIHMGAVIEALENKSLRSEE